MLLLVDTLGREASLRLAIEAAHAREHMPVLLLGGRGTPAMHDLLGETDVLVAIATTARHA